MIVVQEPRALDSGARLVNKFDAYGDKKSAELMKIICDEEIGHVKIGMDWYLSPSFFSGRLHCKFLRYTDGLDYPRLIQYFY